jgi:hypothetical protein
MTSPPSKLPSVIANDTGVDDDTLPPQTATSSRTSIRTCRSVSSSSDKHAAELEKSSPGPLSVKWRRVLLRPREEDFTGQEAVLCVRCYVAFGASHCIRCVQHHIHCKTSLRSYTLSVLRSDDHCSCVIKIQFRSVMGLRSYLL